MSKSEAAIVVDMLSTALFKTGKYNVISKNERDAVLKEQEFSLLDCTDESCQIEIGRLLAADHVVAGTLGKTGDIFVLNIRLVSVSTSQLESTAVRFYDTIGELTKDTLSLVRELAGIRDDADLSETDIEPQQITSRGAEEKAKVIKAYREAVLQWKPRIIVLTVESGFKEINVRMEVECAHQGISDITNYRIETTGIIRKRRYIDMRQEVFFRTLSRLADKYDTHDLKIYLNEVKFVKNIRRHADREGEIIFLDTKTLRNVAIVSATFRKYIDFTTDQRLDYYDVVTSVKKITLNDSDDRKTFYDTVEGEELPDDHFVFDPRKAIELFNRGLRDYYGLSEDDIENGY